MDRSADGRPLMGLEGEYLGTVDEEVETGQGTAVFVERLEDLGGGMTVLPKSQLEDRGDEVVSPYGRLSMLEAPPYSPNVPLTAYLRYWKRLGAGNVNQSESSYLPTGSGPVSGPPSDLSDREIADLVAQALHDARGVAAHAIQVTVTDGTVLLEGEQNDTRARLAAAEAVTAVPGVQEIVNMLVVRAA